MFYNMGDLHRRHERSSIFNTEDTLKYAPYISKYKLPLDLGLPAFSWLVHSRGPFVVDLRSDLSGDDLQKVPELWELSSSPATGRRYKARRSHYFHGVYYVQGDTLDVESIEPADTLQAGELAESYKSPLQRFSTVALFDLNERMSKHYGKNEIEKVFNVFGAR